MSQPTEPQEQTADAAPAARQRRNWTRLAIPAVALLIAAGLGATVAGVAVAAASDPTQTTEYRALQQKLTDAESRATVAEGKVMATQGEALKAKSELSQREAAVAAREQAVAATEQQIAANSITEGTWTVGVDIEPGTYRTSAAVSGRCYWSITKTGSNGDNIIQNDIVTGGFPTVRLGAGQDFTTNRCGTWVKQ